MAFHQPPFEYCAGSRNDSMSRPKVGTSQISAMAMRKIRNAPPPLFAAMREAKLRLIEPVTMSDEAVIGFPSGTGGC